MCDISPFPSVAYVDRGVNIYYNDITITGGVIIGTRAAVVKYLTLHNPLYLVHTMKLTLLLCQDA